MDALGVRSWITLDVAKKLLADCGQELRCLKKTAMTKAISAGRLERENDDRFEAKSPLF